MCMLFSSMINAFRISTSSLVYPQAANWKGGLARETSCTVAVGTCGRPHTLTTPLRVWLGVGRALAAPASPHVASEVRETKDPKSSLTPYYPPPQARIFTCAQRSCDGGRGLKRLVLGVLLVFPGLPRDPQTYPLRLSGGDVCGTQPGFPLSWLRPLLVTPSQRALAHTGLGEAGRGQGQPRPDTPLRQSLPWAG